LFELLMYDAPARHVPLVASVAVLVLVAEVAGAVLEP
jgi:hypothetical protein